MFAVTNPKKPDKVRLVWDAAAKVDNISLNSMLLTGPDQLIPLPDVLSRFRQRKIAICADIREMFHQVHIREADQHSQRFLWRECPDEPLSTYVMQVMTFGATCSPCSANYVKNLNAKEFEIQYPRAAEAIIRNHYVDDLLDSVDTETEAIKLAKEIRYIHAQGGFDIRNFISNSKSVLVAIGEDCIKVQKDLNICVESKVEKILGMWWCTDNDCFTYSTMFTILHPDILTGKRRPTKREVLRILMSVFDPLGFLAFYLVYVKILLQEIWRTSVDWDEKLPPHLHQKWQVWINKLPMVENVRVPRCYTNVIVPDENTDIQLHIFVDASENAYAAVAYLRIQHGEHIECALVGAKTKVAPQKPLSIPRMELQAAVLGTRLANNIFKSHTLHIQSKFMWSDSKTVISWIESDHRKYRQFVAFRIGEILESTNLRDWRWVPTNLNVADEATKWNKEPDFSPTCRWFVGPDFLRCADTTWPKEETKSHNDPIEELRPCYTNVHHRTQLWLIDGNRFSNWKRLVRSVSYVLRFVNNLKSKVSKFQQTQGPIRLEEYERAETFLYRQTQLECYYDEIASLQEKGVVEKNSSIFKSSPYLDVQGVLKMRGRIDVAVGVCESQKRPILLPKKHQITKLIVDFYHRKYHHCSHETTINELRQKYAIPSIRVVLKSVISSCQFCKNRKVVPQPPEMADLPIGRLSSHVRPFTHVGVDYFGPMHVTVGRHSEKRWGVLFTCLTIRAIHLELAHSLDTNSCIMCLRNFIARRGKPRAIYSDNGTNFHGANNELREMLKNVKIEELIEEFTNADTKWIFNPPASPHMGGSWERLVGSVKKVLQMILPKRNPTDEILRNLLIEVESCINSRPLTFIPIDSDSEEALTPNHFLLGSSNGEKPIGTFSDKDLLHKSWRTSQQLSNHFWRRWIREYLPTITRRSKWCEKVKPIEVGDVVIIVDENLPRNTWPKGVVRETVFGKDGQVRQATVQTNKGIYVRPSVKLAVMDVRKMDTENSNLVSDLITNLPRGECCKPKF